PEPRPGGAALSHRPHRSHYLTAPRPWESKAPAKITAGAFRPDRVCSPASRRGKNKTTLPGWSGAVTIPSLTQARPFSARQQDDWPGLVTRRCPANDYLLPSTMNTPFPRVPFLGIGSATKLLVFLLCWPLPSSASEPRKTGPALRTGVEKGTLVIVGGGSLPELVHRRFLELAGGAKGKLVVIPTAY